MRYPLSLLLSSVFICSSLASPADARVWSSSSGAYQLEADVISFNDTIVVLKRTNGDLIAVELKDLSEADREYVHSKEAVDAEHKAADEMQTWTGRDGMKFRGRVTAYGRKQVNVRRMARAVYINDQPFSKLDAIHQQLVLHILADLESTTLDNEKQLDQWSRSIGPSGKTYMLEGVLLQLESGDEIGVPFSLFAAEEMAILEPGWEMWKEREESDASRDHESFLVRSAAMAYQRDRQAKQQIEMMKLDMLAAATGAIAIWQVGLAPAPGVYGRPISVMVPAQNSEIASQMALQRYPGSILVGIRRASR